MINAKALNCFKSYDIRGKIGVEFNEEIAYRIGRSIAQSLSAKTVALGFDARATSTDLAQAVAKGICDAGSDVWEIGLAGTEEVYSAVSVFSADAGVEITASHNPIEYNGMKIVNRSSKPLSNQEFVNIKKLAEKNSFTHSNRIGLVKDRRSDARAAYIKKILDFVTLKNLRPLKIVINSGNGAAGPTIDALNVYLKEQGVKTDFVYVNHQPDSSFPNGIPNPLLEENRRSTADAIVQENADFGVAFDGDFDRCFFFDHFGSFIPGEYIVGLLAKIFLNKEKGSSIIHDPRVIWNTVDVVKKCGGHANLSKTGHVFVKAAMRDFDAIYGGEMSAHHYFRDFDYCDSGMIPWLTIWELLSSSDFSLAALIEERKNSFPSSGELNFKVSDAVKCIETAKDFFSTEAEIVNELDGLSMSFESWRFNLRKSNTEPLIRLNVETIGNKLLLREKTELLKQIVLNS